jgi:hypothetical protein
MPNKFARPQPPTLDRAAARRVAAFYRGNIMKRTVIHAAKTIAVCAALLAATSTAYAANPHFVGPVKATLAGNNAQACFKIAGLGDSVSVTVSATADATATFVCQAKSGQCPNAANKTTVNDEVSASGDFTSDKNGNVSGCLVLTPPGPGNFACPPGQSLVLSKVAYTNIAVDSTPTGSAATTPSTLSVDRGVCPRK